MKNVLLIDSSTYLSTDKYLSKISNGNIILLKKIKMKY